MYTNLVVCCGNNLVPADVVVTGFLPSVSYPEAETLEKHFFLLLLVAHEIIVGRTQYTYFFARLLS